MKTTKLNIINETSNQTNKRKQKKSSKKRKKIWNKTSLRVFVPFVSHLFHSLSIETRNEEKKPNKIFKKLIKIVKQIQSDDEKYLWWKNSYNNNKRRENGVFLYIFILILTIWVNQNSEHINISVVNSLFVFWKYISRLHKCKCMCNRRCLTRQLTHTKHIFIKSIIIQFYWRCDRMLVCIAAAISTILGNCNCLNSVRRRIIQYFVHNKTV